METMELRRAQHSRTVPEHQMRVKCSFPLPDAVQGTAGSIRSVVPPSTRAEPGFMTASSLDQERSQRSGGEREATVTGLCALHTGLVPRLVVATCSLLCDLGSLDPLFENSPLSLLLVL